MHFHKAGQRPNDASPDRLAPGFESVIPNPRLKFLDQIREVMRLKHYSIRTERSYCDWVKRFVHFHQMRSREEMLPAEPKIEAFLSDLAVNGNVAVSTQNQAFNALLFAYQEVLHVKLGLAAVMVRSQSIQVASPVFPPYSPAMQTEPSPKSAQKRRRVLLSFLLALPLYLLSTGPVAWATNDGFHPAYLPPEVNVIYLPLAPLMKIEWISQLFFHYTAVVWGGFPAGYTTL